MYIFKAPKIGYHLNMRPQMRDYFKAYKPKVCLFEGQNNGQYSATSVVAVSKKWALKAGIF